MTALNELHSSSSQFFSTGHVVQLNIISTSQVNIQPRQNYCAQRIPQISTIVYSHVLVRVVG